MALKYFVILFMLEVVLSEKLAGTSLEKKLHKPELSGSNPIFKISILGGGKNEIQKENRRNRRFLTSTLALLWPQVFGPVDQGVIKDSTYKEVPKTLLEHRLDMIRKKAQEEEETRLVIRNYLKSLTEAQDKFYGYPNKGEPGFVVVNLSQ